MYADERGDAPRQEVGTGNIKLPGFGLPIGFVPREHFPLLYVNHGSNYDVWKADTLLIREVCMLRLVEELTNKPDWWIKVHDEAIASRWKQEALEFNWAAYRAHADFTPAMADAVINELKVKADLYEKTGLIPVMDYAETAIKSDKIMTDELREELKMTVARLLENVPDDQKDWHPGSDGKVLDLVHPSLWPLIYGRTRILNNKRIGIDDALEHCGTGLVVPQPLENELRGMGGLGILSDRFQWLPCNVALDLETGAAKIESYINNLHPVHHAALYPIIEKFIQKSLPAWDIIYRWPDDFECLRLACSNVGTKCTTPDACDGHYECRPSNRPLEEGEPERNEDEEWGDEYEASQRGVRDFNWFEATHGMNLPDPDPEDTSHVRVKPDDVKTSGFFHNRDRIQVIVKLANIHLTPEKPTYDGGSWHIEGQLNERIVATALYYYDSENITDSHLDFRTIADREDLSGELGYDQGDYLSINRTFAINAEDDITQDIGSVLTRPGRALFFSNLYMHHVSPFKLADPSRPGHRKILCLFLVDPAGPVISTANVPPQQRDWWAAKTGLSSDSSEAAASRLPAELRNLVVENTDFPISLEDAKGAREELMAERSAMQQKTDSWVSALDWNFCEH